MANDSPASVLVDENGNLIGVELDGAVYRLQTRTKLATGHGLATETTLATLATESKLEAVRALVASIDAKDFATETTQATLATESKLEAVRVILASIDAKDFATETTSAAIQAILAAIRDTAGVKKITDALPPGTNLIGRVRLRNPGDTVDIGDVTNPVRTDPTGTTTQPISAASLPLPTGAATETTLATRATEAKLEAVRALLQSLDEKDFATQTTLAALNTVLTAIRDTAGIKKITDALPVGDNAIGRAKLIDASGNVIASLNDGGVWRLKVEAALKAGSTVSIGSVASTEAFVSKLKNGGAESMRVAGTIGTPVDFLVSADPTQDVILDELRLVFVVGSLKIDGISFGTATTLENGVLVDGIVNNGIAITLATITRNEGFLELAGAFPMIDHGFNDVITTSFTIGGAMTLKAGTGDRIRIRIRDDLTAVNYKYFRATLFGRKV